MPDLDWLAEVGPRFQYTVARAARDAKIDFELPARAVLLSDFTNLHFRGFIAAPRLSYQNENFFAQDLELKLSLGGNWASTRLADYFLPGQSLARDPVAAALQSQWRLHGLVPQSDVFSAIDPENQANRSGRGQLPPWRQQQKQPSVPGQNHPRHRGRTALGILSIAPPGFFLEWFP